MKKRLLILLTALALGTEAFAQQDTITVYQTPRGFFKDPLRSKWKRKLEKEDSLWVLKLFDKKEILQEKISFADENLSVRKGAYEKYEEGKLTETGQYSMGYKIGPWTRYYPNQQLREKANYRWDKLDGPFVSYWENGQLKKDGTYSLGKRTGKWKMFLQAGQLILDENLNAKGEKTDGQYFDAEGKSLPFPMILTAPTYQGGIPAFYRYLGGQIKYPANAVKNHIEGKVLLAFTIKANSAIEDVQVLSSPDRDLSDEAIRVVKLSRGWVPGQELGEPVNMKYTVYVNFTLN